ncbi:hypothetical protein [Streptomyces albidus (ex Kaewkla and Franco 2022)]|uniref:hypothetical protein n=1 Tax=Streptomyces albidus (ex Kaewkla and Franco 2022) TaxID=722709 RepID=UPI0015EF5A0B|nr:hypothetical protein [Streptomyces albidus (ex Kaewkla and Franco 2022)]
MTDKLRRATVTAVTGLGLCLTLLPTGQAQAQAPIRVPCNDIAALKAAIGTANSSGGSIVLASRCVYSLVSADNTDDGLPEITGKVRISGDRTIVQRAPASPAFRIFHVTRGGSLSLKSLTVRGGESAPVTGSNGGGILNERGAVTLTGVTVRNNVSSGLGGGIANLLGTLALKDTTVKDNSAVWGGGVGTNGTMTMRGGALRDNAGGNWGGGLANGGRTTLDHVSVDGNYDGDLGGGIITLAIDQHTGPLRLNFTQVKGNNAQTSGGGLFAGSEEPTTLYRSSVSHNSANGGPATGGGIANSGPSLSIDLGPGSGAKQKSSKSGPAQPPFDVNLIRSTVFKNTPTNCAPPGSVPRCDAVGAAPGTKAPHRHGS